MKDYREQLKERAESEFQKYSTDLLNKRPIDILSASKETAFKQSANDAITFGYVGINQSKILLKYDNPLDFLYNSQLSMQDILRQVYSQSDLMKKYIKDVADCEERIENIKSDDKNFIKIKMISNFDKSNFFSLPAESIFGGMDLSFSSVFPHSMEHINGDRYAIWDKRKLDGNKITFRSRRGEFSVNSEEFKNVVETAFLKGYMEEKEVYSAIEKEKMPQIDEICPIEKDNICDLSGANNIGKEIGLGR